MLRHSQVTGIALVGLVLASVLACESQPSSERLVSTAPVDQAKGQTGSQHGVAPVTEAGLLVAPATSLGRSANDEGVAQGQQSQWDAAEKAFRKAISIDDNLAEAQFNLGIALDKLGKREEAAKAFKKAKELAPTNRLITESEV